MARYIDTELDNPGLRSFLEAVAGLSLIQYDLEREGHAKILGIRAHTLDRLVEDVRRELKRNGGDAQRGPPLIAKPYARCDPRTISPRPVVYGKHYTKGYVSVTVSPGGGGKSSLGIVEAISMAIGRCLFSDLPLRFGPMRVWYLALEDPEDEMIRKVEATCMYYGIHDPIPGLFLNSGRDRPICVAVETKSEGGLISVVAEPDVDLLVAEARERAIDVIIVDPSVSSHKVPENDSVKQDAVMALWRAVGEHAGVSVELQHHSRKLNHQQIGIDDVRGASAIVNSARSVRLLANMSKEDADDLGVEEDRRGYHFCVVNGKANFLPRAKEREWFEFHSVCLGNETPQYEGDSVGVVSRWHSPAGKRSSDERLAMARTRSLEDSEQVERFLRAELQLGHRYSLRGLQDLTKTLGMSRDRIREAVALLLADGRVRHEDVPGARRGQRTFLCPAE